MTIKNYGLALLILAIGCTFMIKATLVVAHALEDQQSWKEYQKRVRTAPRCPKVEPIYKQTMETKCRLIKEN